MNRKIICRFEGNTKDLEFSPTDYPECCGVYTSLLKHALINKIVKFEVIDKESS